MAKAPNRPPSEKPPADAGAPERPPPEIAIRRGILAALGQPPGLFDVTVKPLWGNRFRVNVLIGADTTSVRIAHSFFVEVGPGGDILTATPRITKTYP